MEAARRREARNVTTTEIRMTTMAISAYSRSRVRNSRRSKTRAMEPVRSPLRRTPRKKIRDSRPKYAPSLRLAGKTGTDGCPPAVFRKNVPLFVVETGGEDMRFRREGAQHLPGGPLIVERQRSGRVCAQGAGQSSSFANGTRAITLAFIDGEPQGREQDCDNAGRKGEEGEIETDGEVPELHGSSAPVRRRAARHRGGKKKQSGADFQMSRIGRCEIDVEADSVCLEVEADHPAVGEKTLGFATVKIGRSRRSAGLQIAGGLRRTEKEDVASGIA